MIIRPIREDEALVVGALWLELVEYHLQLDTAMPMPAEDGAQRYAHRVRNRIDDPYTQTFVAELDGEIVGYVMGVVVDMLPEMFVTENGGFLADIYVRDSHRGKGVGRALVAALKDWFRGRGIEHFEWYVASANTEGIAFWRAVNGRDVMLRMRAATSSEPEE